jgi:site-specific recombinase XerD
MSEHLKEIADRCEINKKMAFHTARHIPIAIGTITVTLTNGVPVETVSKMLGHKNTEDYAAVCEDFGSEGE